MGGGFDYFLNGKLIRKRAEIARLDELAIPPAWHGVQIAESRAAKVLAVGIDAAGRTQAIYHPKYRARQDRKKFDRMERFGRSLPRLRARVDHDLRRWHMPQERVVACIVRIMDQHLLRIGSPEYAKTHHSYGVTTLRRKHLHATTASVEFDFIGKSGKRQRGRIRDPRVVRVILQLQEAPGQDIFQYLDDDGCWLNVHGQHVNAYVKRHQGREFSAKDFRTWGGTVAVATQLLAAPPELLESGDSRRRVLRDAISAASGCLGNTPSVTRSSYVDPRVLDAVNAVDVLEKIRRWNPPVHDYLAPEELKTLKLLEAMTKRAGR